MGIHSRARPTIASLLVKRNFVTSDYAHAWSATVLKRHFFTSSAGLNLNVKFSFKHIVNPFVKGVSLLFRADMSC